MSAGYILYSLDWDKFRQLVERPTQKQLTALATLLREERAEYEGGFQAGDPMAKWPADVPALADIVATRLALPDWYGDLSRSGKFMWEGVILNACMECEDIDVGFNVDHDGVYWDVIEIAWEELGVVPNTISKIALSEFGARPFRYHPSPRPATSRADYDQNQARQRADLDALGQALGQLLESAKRGKEDPEKLLADLKALEAVSPTHKGLIKDLLDEDSDDDDDDDDDVEWEPMHSMHTPDEVKKMLAELVSVESAMKKTKKKDARKEYEEDLMPTIEGIVAEGRMLFVQVDT